MPRIPRNAAASDSGNSRSPCTASTPAGKRVRDGLRKHYTDLQILEMVLSVSGNNAINRWKEGAGVPQSPGVSS